MMAIRRGRFHTPAYMSTKGHSVLSQRSYAMPSRTPLSTGVSRASSVAYDTRVEDYLLSERVNNVSYLSNSTLDMTDDTAKRSRGRDQQLLRDATQAIPRGSVRDTAAVTSSPSPFGPRRFPRRFGKAKLRSSQSSSFYATRLSPTRGKDGSTADLMASPGPAPSGSWRRPGTRSASVARSSFDSDYSSVAEKPTSRYRAHSVGPTSSRSLSMYRPSFPSPSPPPVSRRALPPLPSTSVSQSQVFGISRTGGSRSFPSSRSSYGSAPVHPGYDPLYVEYEPDTKPTPRRRQRVLASSRRPAGNYYERLLRKRGKNQGRFGPYYDVESIEGSDLSGVLSDVDSADGTYDGDNDLECSGVSSSSYRDHHNHHNHNDLSSSYSDSVSPSSPYYVDQDTEFVPFKPSRPLQTKGLLELSPLYDDDDEDDNESSSYSNALPSPTTDLSLSRYLPASLTPTPTASLSSSGAAASASGGISLPSLPYQTLVPYTTSPADDSLAVQSSPTPSQQLLESLVSSAVQRAKGALNDLAIPGYHGASLLLSVEGAGLSPEGKRVGFTYTPPPIPLFGRGLSLDEKLAGLRPLSVLKPVDHFLAGYMERMGALREALNDRLDKDKARRLQYGLKPLETGPRLSSRTSTPIPDYTQSYDYVPVRQLSSQKLERLPVTTFRRRQDDGRTQRLDVIPLGEIRPRLPSSSARAITIPESVTGGHKLSVLDKINIKVSSESYATPQASVASRRVARGRSLVPRAASVPPRPLYHEVDSTLAASTTDKTSTTTTTTATFTQASSDSLAPSRARRPIIVYAAPAQRRAMSVPPPPLVFRKEEGKHLKAPARVPPRDVDWRSRARARSVPPTVAPAPRPLRPGPRRYRAAERALMLPLRAVPLLPLPTAGLRAHKVPRRFLTRTGVRTAFGSLRGYYDEGEAKRERRELEEMARARGLTPLPTEGLRAHRVPLWFTSLRAYYGLAGLAAGRGREDEATSGIRKSVTRARVLASPLARATLARGWGRVAQTLAFHPKPKPAPIHVSLSGFPKVYVPSKGPKPSNRSKAAIIASKLEPDPIKRRRPRSEFAANKYRSMRKEAQESVYAGTPQSSGLYSSVPPLPKPSERKAIRTDDGYSKPKNLLSWQYRLDAKMAPSDLLYQPSSFIRIREQLRDAQERMDRHRQMLDRYLPEGGADTGDVVSSIRRKMADMERRDPVIGGGADSRGATVNVPSSYASGVDPSNPPMSDLRRRIRKTLNKTRNSSVF